MAKALGDVIAGGHEVVELGRALRVGGTRVPLGGRAHEPAAGARAGDVEESPLLAALAVAQGVGHLLLGAQCAPVGQRVAILVTQPPRKGGAGGEGVFAGARVGEHLRPTPGGAGETGHVHGVELEALGLVDGHHLHRVGIG